MLLQWLLHFRYSNQFETRELIGHVLFFQIEPVTSLLPRIVCLLEVQYLSEAFREVFVEWLFFRDLLAFYFTLEWILLNVFRTALFKVACLIRLAFSTSCCQLQVQIEFARKLFVWEGYQRNLCKCPLSIKLELRLKFTSRTADLLPPKITNRVYCLDNWAI